MFIISNSLQQCNSENTCHIALFNLFSLCPGRAITACLPVAWFISILDLFQSWIFLYYFICMTAFTIARKASWAGLQAWQYYPENISCKYIFLLLSFMSLSVLVYLSCIYRGLMYFYKSKAYNMDEKVSLPLFSALFCCLSNLF